MTATTTDQVVAFERDGFIAVPELLGKAEVEALLGPDIKFFGDQMLLTPPFHGSAKPYHQDSAYWTIDPPALVTCWIALDDSTIENGCMRFLPGSHRWGVVPHRHLDPVHWVPEELEAMDLSREVCVELKAGGATFHHSATLHQSLPNTTPYPRRGHTLAYMSAQSRYTGKPPQPEYPLVRGREYAGCV